MINLIAKTDPIAHHRSLIAQRIHRIRRCRFDGLEADSHQRDKKRQYRRQHKNHPTDLNPVIVICKPVMKIIPGDWHSNDTGNRHQQHELLGKQSPQVGHNGPQYFADADLLGPLLGHKTGHAEQPQAGNKYGKYREIRRQLTDSFFGPEFVPKCFVHKGVIKRYGGYMFSPNLFNLADGLAGALVGTKL